MAQRPAPGRTPARDADPAFDDVGRPSKSQLKRDAHELQQLGKDLAELPLTRLLALDMPDSLRDAVIEFKRTRSHEGRRRQLQYVGKQMRLADAEPLREAVAQMKLGSAVDSLTLHEAERWREELLADDECATRWVQAYPDSDVQQLRQLVRQARQQRQEAELPGHSLRQGRAYRELFRLIREHLDTGASAPSMDTHHD